MKNKIIPISLIILTIIATVVKIYTGWDQDESYNMILTYRIIAGDVIFRDIWDLHQTSSVLPAILAIPYVRILGSAYGMAVYLRIMTTLIQFAVSVLAFFILRKWYGFYPAFAASLLTANMLPRAINQLEYGLSSVLFMIICNLILLDIWKSGNNKRYISIALAGLCYAFSVFVYPTMIISLPVFLYVILIRISEQKRFRLLYSACFFGACAILAAVFFIYVLHYVSLSEFIGIIREFNKESFHPHRFAAFYDINGMIKSGIRIILMIIISALVYCISAAKIRDNRFILTVFICLISLVLIILNVFSLRPSGPFGLLERYIVCVILTPLLIHKTKDAPMFWLFYIAGIGQYLGSLMGSALGFNENAMFLEASLIAMLVWLVKYTEELDDHALRTVAALSIIIFITGIIFSKGYFRRVNQTKPANNLECDSILTTGPFSGIIIDSAQKTDYDAHIADINALGDTGYLCMYLGNDPIYNFFFPGESTNAMYVGTALPNSLFVDYYTIYKHPLPETIYVDKYKWPDINDLYKQDFGSFIKDKYIISDTGNDNLFTLLIKKQSD